MAEPAPATENNEARRVQMLRAATELICERGFSETRISDVAKRAADWFEGLTGPTIAVSHGGFSRILRGLYYGLGWQQMSGLDEPYGTVFKFYADQIIRIGPPPSGKLR